MPLFALSWRHSVMPVFALSWRHSVMPVFTIKLYAIADPSNGLASQCL